MPKNFWSGTYWACAKGGALETMVQDHTGVFVASPTIAALMAAVARFETMRFDASFIRQHAQRFRRERCREALRSSFVEYQQEMS